MRRAFALVARLALYALGVGLCLEAVVALARNVAVEAVVREDGPLEIAQCALAFVSAAVLVAAGSRARGSTVVLLLGCACAFAGVRELDGLLRERIAPGSWKYFEVPVVASAVALAWRGRSRLVDEFAAFVGSPSAWLLFFGATLILVHAQVLGQKELWYAVLTDENARTVKKAFEECSETTGYLMVAAGAFEAWLQARSCGKTAACAVLPQRALP